MMVLLWLNSEDFITQIMSRGFGLVENGRLISSTTAHLIDIDNIECMTSNEDSKEYYQYPKELTQPESYEIFTRDFSSIHMTLATSQIYYYGINEKTLETEIFSFAYSSEKNCYVASDCQPVLCDEFVREIEKEVLYLRKVSR